MSFIVKDARWILAKCMKKKRKENDVSTKTLGVGYSVKKEIYGEIYNVQECV